MRNQIFSLIKIYNKNNKSISIYWMIIGNKIGIILEEIVIFGDLPTAFNSIQLSSVAICLIFFNIFNLCNQSALTVRFVWFQIWYHTPMMTYRMLDNNVFEFRSREITAAALEFLIPIVTLFMHFHIIRLISGVLAFGALEEVEILLRRFLQLFF